MPEPGSPPDPRPYVAEAAAEALGADGLFMLPEPVAPSTRPIITMERARLLAASYVLSFGPSLKRYWDAERGETIRLEGLQPDARVFHAMTPYGVFPEGYHSAFGRAVGPYHVVVMRSEGTRVLLVGVAAYSTEVEIDAEGKIQRPVQRGNEFVSQGIPRDTLRADLSWLVSPEEAVVRVGRLTGARVRAVPELAWPGISVHPLASLWKLSLDRAVRVRYVKSGRVAEVQHLYVGPEAGRKLMVPAAGQPTEFAIPAIRIGANGEELGTEQVRVSIRPGMATIFEEVVVERGGGG